MFTSYLKNGLPSFLRNKAYSLINLAGLSIGLACGFLIVLWLTVDLTINRYGTHLDWVYQIVRNHHSDAVVHTWKSIPKPTTNVMDKDIPAISNSLH